MRLTLKAQYQAILRARACAGRMRAGKTGSNLGGAYRALVLNAVHHTERTCGPPTLQPLVAMPPIQNKKRKRRLATSYGIAHGRKHGLRPIALPMAL